MKKKLLFIVLFIFCLFMFACTKKTEEKTKTLETQVKETETLNETKEGISRKLNELSYKFDNNVHYRAWNSVRSNDEYITRLNNFLYKLSSDLVNTYNNDTNKNIVYSPISIYLVLALSTVICDEATKTEIINGLGITEEDLKLTTDLVFSLISNNYSEDYFGIKKIISKLDIVNSIWLDNNLNADNDILKILADDYYCQAYDAPFKDNNKEANEALSKYIKERTNGLIDQNFGLDTDTLFALVNTIYLKALWKNNGEDLNTIQKLFTNYNGVSKEIEFLIGTFESGKIQVEEDYSFFYIKLENGYKMTFIVPNDDVDLKDVYNYDSIKKAVNFIYEFHNEELMEEYYTKCIFPSFKAESNNDVKELFRTNYNIKKLFDSFYCPLINEYNIFTSQIKHIAKLDVNKSGIEAAAVTIAVECGESAPLYKKVYFDFLIDKPFGYVITDNNGIILFNGLCNNPF